MIAVDSFATVQGQATICLGMDTLITNILVVCVKKNVSYSCY